MVADVVTVVGLVVDVVGSIVEAVVVVADDVLDNELEISRLEANKKLTWKHHQYHLGKIR